MEKDRDIRRDMEKAVGDERHERQKEVRRANSKQQHKIAAFRSFALRVLKRKGQLTYPRELQDQRIIENGNKAAYFSTLRADLYRLGDEPQRSKATDLRLIMALLWTLMSDGEKTTAFSSPPR